MISLTAMVDLWQQAKSFWRPNAFHFGSNEPIEKEYSVSMMSSSLQYESEDVIATLDSYGNTTHWQQDAFGRAVPGSTPWEPMSSSPPKEHLTGKMYDNVTGLYYFHARWYDPTSSLFLSRDPLLNAHTIKHVPPSSISKSFNNNPMLYFDTSGLWPISSLELREKHLLDESVRDAVKKENSNGRGPYGCGDWDSVVVYPALRRVSKCHYECASCVARGFEFPPVHIFSVCRLKRDTQKPWTQAGNWVFDAWDLHTPLTGYGVFRTLNVHVYVLKWSNITCEAHD